MTLSRQEVSQYITLTIPFYLFRFCFSYWLILYCIVLVQVIRRLRERGEPIRLFGESDYDAFQRLRKIEILTPEVNKVRLTLCGSRRHHQVSRSRQKFTPKPLHWKTACYYSLLLFDIRLSKYTPYAILFYKRVTLQNKQNHILLCF